MSWKVYSRTRSVTRDTKKKKKKKKKAVPRESHKERKKSKTQKQVFFFISLFYFELAFNQTVVYL